MSVPEEIGPAKSSDQSFSDEEANVSEPFVSDELPDDEAGTPLEPLEPDDEVEVLSGTPLDIEM